MSLETIKYPNGLRAYVDHMPSAHTTETNVFIPYGSVDEAPGEEGIAHALEHSVFLRTPRFPNKDSVRMHAKLSGMYQNANTYYTRTVHETHGIDPEPSYRHLSELVQHAQIPDDDATQEMKAVRREAMTRLDNVGEAHALASSMAMFGAPYGRAVIGFHEQLDFSGEQLRQAYERNYALGNMAILSVGATTTDDVDRLIRQYFDVNYSRPLPPAQSLPQPSLGKDRLTGYAADESNNVRLKVAYPLTDEFRTRMLAQPGRIPVAMGVMRDECFNILREDKGISYDGGVYLSTYNHPNAWSMYGSVTTDAEHLETANEVIDEIFSRPSSWYSDKQILGSLAMSKYRLLSTIESMGGRMATYLDRLECYEEPRSMETIADIYHALTPDDIRASIDEIVQLALSQPRYEQRTGSRMEIGDVDRVIHSDEIH